jgi:hypothetical protein
VPVDVIDLFMKISLHTAAYRRIELSEVADLHGGFVIPSEVEESLISFYAHSYKTEMLRLRSA